MTLPAYLDKVATRRAHRVSVANERQYDRKAEVNASQRRQRIFAR
jgi:hypothetical protein